MAHLRPTWGPAHLRAHPRAGPLGPPEDQHTWPTRGPAQARPTAQAQPRICEFLKPMFLREFEKWNPDKYRIFQNNSFARFNEIMDLGVFSKISSFQSRTFRTFRMNSYQLKLRLLMPSPKMRAAIYFYGLDVKNWANGPSRAVYPLVLLKTLSEVWS